MTPEWSNVYNRVSVRLASSEFEGQVTNKEVDAARFLDTVGKVRLSDEVDVDMPFEHIVSLAKLDGPQLQNVQEQATSLLESHAQGHQKTGLFLTQ